MNLKTPMNPDKLADTWPAVEHSIAQVDEAKAIEAYLKSIDKKSALRPDRGRGRRWK